MTEDDIIDGILAREGGFSNHPADAGGPTKYGITQQTLSDWLGHAATTEEVMHLSQDEAREIYREQYVKPFRDVEAAVRVQAIDIAVHSGVNTAFRLLQRARDRGGDLGVALFKERLRHLANVIERRPANVAFIRGWIDRALQFL